MTLKSNGHLVLGHNVNGPTEYTVDPFLDSIAPLKERYTSGSDGSRIRTWRNKILFLPRRVAKQHFSAILTEAKIAFN